VILKDVKYDDIKALVEFMYRGEINIEQVSVFIGVEFGGQK
jgi:BTB/POZ domain